MNQIYKKHRQFNKLVSAVLCAAMSINILPISALATEADMTVKIVQDIQPLETTVYEVLQGTALDDIGLPTELMVLLPEELPPEETPLPVVPPQEQEKPPVNEGGEELPDGEGTSPEDGQNSGDDGNAPDTDGTEAPDNNPEQEGGSSSPETGDPDESIPTGPDNGDTEQEGPVENGSANSEPENPEGSEPSENGNEGDNTGAEPEDSNPQDNNGSSGESVPESSGNSDTTEISDEPVPLATTPFNISRVSFVGNQENSSADSDVPADYISAAISWEGEYDADTAGTYTLTAAFQDETLYAETMPTVDIVVLPLEDEYDSISLDELKELPNEVAGAATIMESDGLLFSLFQSLKAIFADDWSFDAIYVNQLDTYDVTMVEDFNLKYQMNFHSDLDDLEPETVIIRIPAALYNNRSGEAVYPDDIAVPEGYPDNPQEAADSPFNYYMEDDDLVFWNYKTISKGTSTAFQVSYKNQHLMDIVDGTEWNLTPTVTIKHAIKETQTDETTGETTEVITGYETEEQQSTPLTGRIDSGVELSTVSKAVYSDTVSSYTPGLYTEKQIERYITGNLPEAFRGENFNNYYYVVWKARVTGSATQPWTLKIEDIPTAIDKNRKTVEGKLVGYSMTIEQGNFRGTTTVTENTLTTQASDEEEILYSACIVAAYPSSTLVPGSTVQNKINVMLHPVDGKDEDQTKSASDKWQYKEYDWTYQGNTIGISKQTQSGLSKGWLTAYRTAQKNNEDYGSLLFSSNSSCRGYSFTHRMVKDTTLGDYIPGTYYTISTADDVIYAYETDGDGERVELTDKDYYFSDVSFNVTDSGYDVWEDATSDVEDVAGIDRNVYIYAMFAGSTTWEKVGTSSWNENGSMTYRFDSKQLERQPYRVKAVHNATDYSSNCNIYVNVSIRKDSPVINNLIKQGAESISIENLSSVLGRSSAGDTIHDGEQQKGNEINYDYYTGYNRDLRVISQNLYANEYDNWTYVPPQRDNGVAKVSELEENARSYKTGSIKNDPIHGRVLVDYNLTAYEGYEVTSEADFHYIKNNQILNDIALPSRNTLEFYDLLPSGMHFNLTSTPTAGRLVGDLNKDAFKENPKAWDSAQVSVEMADYIENYNNTGRNLVKFRLTYDGADPTVFANGLWYTGWGVHFQAYYDWSELPNSIAESNISAFMPGPEDTVPLLGKDTQIAMDNGEMVSEFPEVVNALKDHRGKNLFGSDINSDGETNIRNILYANAKILDDIATASTGELEKLVRADNDIYADPGKSATVGYGLGYTYTLTAKVSDSTEMSNIIFFDQIESLVDKNEWFGQFNGVHTTDAEKKGAKVTIYYNEARESSLLPNNADDSSGTAANLDPSKILTERNGWFTEEQWMSLGNSYADVKSIAVKLDDLTLHNNQTVSVKIKMIAPTLEELSGDTSLISTHNEPHMLATTTSTASGQSVPKTHFYDQDPVVVSLKGSHTFEVVKAFDSYDKVPKALWNSDFRFFLTRVNTNGDTPFAYKEYELWQLDENNTWKEIPGLYGTDADGMLELKAGQKAVFHDLAGSDTIKVEEEDSIFWNWKATETENEETGVVTRTITNNYRPILYLQKDTQAVPAGVQVKDDSFTFKVSFWDETKAEYVPAANRQFWYVNQALTNGVIPSKNTSLGNNGVGYTDENGCVTFKKGQTIAVIGDFASQKYKVEEVQTSDNWICLENTNTGFLGNFGSIASITNYYRWKDLIINKTVTHQEIADAVKATDEFTFKITRDDGSPVIGNQWVLLDNKGKETSIAGTLDEQGTFKVACAGRQIKVKGLAGNESYHVKEIATSDNYIAVNDSASAKMPIYSSSKTVTITNDYLWRDLNVKKTVVTNTSSTVEHPAFEFIVMDENGKTMGNVSYRIEGEGDFQTDERGAFQLKDGQTAVFPYIGKKGSNFIVRETPQAGYPQLLPADGAANEVTLTDGENLAAFVNGSPSLVMISKEFKATPDDTIANEVIKGYVDTNYAVPITLKVTENGKTYNYPKADAEVSVITDGVMSNKTWKAGEPFHVGINDTVILRDIPAGAKYTLKEDSNYQDRWESYTDEDTSQNYYIHIKAENGTIQGDTILSPTAKLVNHVTSTELPGESEHYSFYYKVMTKASSPVPDGAKLVFRVEEYDQNTGTWSGIDGIPYMILHQEFHLGPDGYIKWGDDAQNESGGFEFADGQSSRGGKITLSKKAGFEPGVYFPEHEVWANLYSQGDIARAIETMNGIYGEDSSWKLLRLVEVPAESDPAWGQLVGYGYRYESRSSDGVSFYLGNLSSDYSINKAFVNSNVPDYLDIGKSISSGAPSDTEFTFSLRQVISMSTETVCEETEVYESIVAADFPYTIYDSVSGKELSSANTGSNGEIRIKAGQFARVPVSSMTTWLVTEQVPASHTLLEIESNAAYQKELDTNSMLLQVKNDTVNRVSIEAECDRLIYPGDTIYPEDFLVGIYYSDGTVRQLSPDEFSIHVTNAPIEGDSFYQTITILETGEEISCLCEIEKLPEISLTREILEAGIYDIQTLEPIEFYDEDTYTLAIPKFVNYEGENYLVTGVGGGGYGSIWDTSCESVILPDSIKTIGDWAFEGFYALTEIAIPESVESIGDCAFMNSGLTAITIPSSVESIGAAAFEDCWDLENVVISDGVKYIGEYAFSRSNSITSITIPGSVETIGDYAFYPQDGINNLTTVIISEGVKEIGEGAFNGCEKLTTVSLPESLESIGGYAFAYCPSLTEVVISGGVETIGEYAFDSCTGLTSVTLGSVKSIGDYAFCYCESLDTIPFPEGLETIGSRAFDGCVELSNVNIPSTLKTITPYSFEGCPIENIEVDEGRTEITASIMREFDSARSVELPNSLTEIGSGSFLGFSNLEKIVIPDSVNDIGVEAFSSCTSLKTLVLPDSLKEIRTKTFKNCSTLDNLLIPNSVTKIGDEAFTLCSSLTNVRIPGSVKSIGTKAFADCFVLRNITISEGVTSIGPGAFSNCGMRDITIPSSVTSINSTTFLKCNFMTDITVNRKENAISGSPWGAPKATVTWTGTT